MKSLVDYDLLVNDVFYRCWHILDYIEAHPNMSELEKESIAATIMEALVSKKLINPQSQSLDLNNMAIVDDQEHYCYEKHPRICGIPLWMKEKFRQKSLYIIGSVPISLRLTRPPSKIFRSCVYDPNYAVSSIFDDATFIDAIYDSPTRPGVRLTETRPFVEVNIDGVDYLVDVLTKRILKSDWFKETYNMEIKSSITISKCSTKEKAKYKELTKEANQLGEMLPLFEALIHDKTPDVAEYNYEFEKTKTIFPEEWEKAEIYKKEMENHENFMDIKIFQKIFRQKKDE